MSCTHSTWGAERRYHWRTYCRFVSVAKPATLVPVKALPSSSNNLPPHPTTQKTSHPSSAFRNCAHSSSVAYSSDRSVLNVVGMEPEMDDHPMNSACSFANALNPLGMLPVNGLLPR